MVEFIGVQVACVVEGRAWWGHSHGVQLWAQQGLEIIP